MLARVLEREVMDSPEEAQDYDAMDHDAVNRRFIHDFLAIRRSQGRILDVGTGTAQIPILLCEEDPNALVLAIDYAEHMLRLARRNIRQAGLEDRLQVQRCDAKTLPFAAASFAAVISNSIVHHIPEPARVLQEMVRVVAPGGLLFVRDLLRPRDEAQVHHLVACYAGDANDQQRQMFEASLRAALSLREIGELVDELGFPADSACRTSDRHWTWVGQRSANRK